MSIPTEKNEQGFQKKWLGPGLGQQMDKLKLKHLGTTSKVLPKLPGLLPTPEANVKKLLLAWNEQVELQQC